MDKNSDKSHLLKVEIIYKNGYRELYLCDKFDCTNPIEIILYAGDSVYTFSLYDVSYCVYSDGSW